VERGSRQWLVLAVVATAQLMVVLDVTIVNIALPSAQRALGFATTDRQWIITAYALAFGSLLLLGGRIGDLFGRKWAFITGLAGFALSSAAGGAAGSFGVLVAARAAQGVFAALLAPAALSILATTFRDSADRGKAFGTFAAVSTGGSAVGLILGGVLTQNLSWRYCLYVNLIFAVVAIAGALMLLGHTPAQHPHLDIPGTVLASAGLFAIVYGLSHAAASGWSSPLSYGALVAGVVILAGFVLFQQRAEHPLLPLRVILDRNRGGAYLSVAIAAIAIFGLFLFMTFYFQLDKGYDPVITGLAFLPLTAATIMASTMSNIKLLPRFGPRPLVVSGMVLGAAGMFWLTRIDVHSGYVTSLLGPLIILGLGFGLTFGPSINVATAKVNPGDAGVASALVNTMQQVGGSIGTALLSTLAVSATASYLASHHGHGAAIARAASVHGYTTGFLVAGCIFVLGAIVASILLHGRPGAPAER
jgi:EmrB/QacA subfamily drug resistance transporter